MDKRLVKIALINMGYRKMRTNDDGVTIYGKPFANTLIRADVAKDELRLNLIVRSGSNQEMMIYHSESVSTIVRGEDDNYRISYLVESIAISEGELFVNKASACGSWPPDFNFLTPSDMMSIETDI